MPLSGDSRDHPWPFAQEVYDRSRTKEFLFGLGDVDLAKGGVTGSA